MNTALLTLNGVNLTLSNQTILSGISFELAEKEILTIIGPNGAGKSSLIKIIAGLQAPTGGERIFNRKHKVGYVPQKLFMDKSMPIKVSRFLSLSRAEKREYRQSLEQVGGASLWSKQMHALSGGELQRVLLARAIARKPKLLLLDEPLQGVDINGQTELYRLIVDIRDTLQCAVVMVSHDLHLVMAQTDHVICLNQHMCCHGKPESVSKHPEYLKLFGANSAAELAVYSHHHDHHHTLDGDVQRCDAGCDHD